MLRCDPRSVDKIILIVHLYSPRFVLLTQIVNDTSFGTLVFTQKEKKNDVGNIVLRYEELVKSGRGGNRPVNNLCRSSHNVLNRYTAARLTGETLFARIGRAVCEAECLPRKEFFEAWETAKRIRRQMRGGPIVELAAGHGLLSAILLILDNSSDVATCVDIDRPLSHERVLKELENRWPRLKDRVQYIESRIEDVHVSSDSLLASIHACGELTDQVLDLALRARCRVAVLPCCHDLKRCDTGSLAGWMDGPLAVDATRVARLRQAGYRVLTTHIPEDITPKNRLLMGWPE
ncbi:MAG: methyltransferase [Deltaproteobacteria bacterium]|nr:methyltransferase [Deltaproteobacteria bacterium]